MVIKGTQMDLPKTKDKEIQCDILQTHPMSTMMDASVQCRGYLFTSSPLHNPSESEFSDLECLSQVVDTSAATFSPGTNSSW